MTPDIIALNRDFREKDPRRFENTAVERRAVADSIGQKEPDAAEGAMRRHMDMSRKRRLGGNSLYCQEQTDTNYVDLLSE